MENRHRLIQALAFSQIRGLNLNTATGLLSRVGSCENFFQSPASALQSLFRTKPDIYSDEYRQELLRSATDELSFMESGGIRVALPFETDIQSSLLNTYPIRLHQCEDAPAALFSIGELNTDDYLTIGIVGTRHASAYGAEFTKQLVKELAERLDNIAIISGLAYGIDVAAHKAALDAGVPTAAVVAHPLNTIYPSEHRQIAARIVKSHGALFTEYTSSHAIHRGNFLARNRIVAGMCDCLVVVESDVKGGAMSTARIASAYNREVFAVPGRVSDKYSSGCLKLLANGIAQIVRDATDIIQAMNWTEKECEGTQKSIDFQLNAEQQQILEYIKQNPDDTINEICVQLGLPYNIVADRLLSLELADIITSVAGGRYAILNNL